MDTRTEQQRREAAAYQFELQAARLGFSVLEKLTNYRYRVLDNTKGCELVAIVLAHTFDFYEYRINKGKHRIDLLIVQSHNAVAPIPVVSMEESREYPPGKAPALLERADRQRRNQEEKKLFVSALLIGSKEAQAELERMPLRTRQRYLHMRDTYLKPKVGRPRAS